MLNELEDKFKLIFQEIDKPIQWNILFIEIYLCDKGRVRTFKTCFKDESDVVINFHIKYKWDTDDFLKNLYNESILSANKWNRINFTKSKRGQSSVEIFWDETYFIEMHNVSYEVYYQEELGKL